MEELKIQKQLKDFRCFKDHYSKMQFTVFDNEGNCTAEDTDLNTDRILILADNPYQLNIAVQHSDHHGTIYHLNYDAEMDFDFIEPEFTGYVYFKDKDHDLIFSFSEKDWKEDR